MKILDLTLTDNFYKLSKSMIIGSGNALNTTTTSQYSSDAVTLYEAMIDTEGNSRQYIDGGWWGSNSYESHYTCNFASFSNNNSLTTFVRGNDNGFYLGTGRVIPTESDIVLAVDPTSPVDENNLSTQIENTNFSFSLTQNKHIQDGKYICSYILSINNISSDILTINEIALMKRLPYADKNYCFLLMGRGVFDTPIILNPQESEILKINLII